MIGVFQDEEVFALGVSAGEAEGEFVGFAAGVDEEADAQGFGKKRGETFGVSDDVVVEIASVGVEQSQLLWRRRALRAGWLWPTSGTLL